MFKHQNNISHQIVNLYFGTGFIPETINFESIKE